MAAYIVAHQVTWWLSLGRCLSHFWFFQTGVRLNFGRKLQNRFGFLAEKAMDLSHWEEE